MYTKSNARIGTLAVTAICLFSFGVAGRSIEHESATAGEAANQLTGEDAKALLARTRVIYISSHTVYFKPAQLQNALRKRSEFETLKLAIIDTSDRQNNAQVNIEIDRPFFTYHFTYKITDRGTGLVLATGTVTAFDGNAAAPKLAGKIVEEITNAQSQMKNSH